MEYEGGCTLADKVLGIDLDGEHTGQVANRYDLFWIVGLIRCAKQLKSLSRVGLPFQMLRSATSQGIGLTAYMMPTAMACGMIRRISKGEMLLGKELSALYILDGLQYATDDVSNAWRDPKLVAEARKTEMNFFGEMQVYDRVDRSEMVQRGGKIIKIPVD